MKRLTGMGAGALGVLLLSGCQTVPSVDPVGVAQQIKARDQQWVDAIAKQDLATIVSIYSDDAVLLPPNTDARNGEAIRKEWADTLALPGLHLSFAPTRIEVDEDAEMAIDVGTYTFSFDGPKGKVDDHGKYAQVWEKKDGVWKCAVDMYNTSVPMPQPIEVAAPPAPTPPPALPKPAKTKKK